MWMLTFSLLPLLALAYIGWHVWCLLPLGWLWKVLIIALMTGAFMLLFAGFMRTTDRMPMPLAIASYEIGTSSIIILLYLFMLFLVLDLGRLFRLVPRTLLYNNWWTAGTIAIGMFALFLYGYLHYQHKHREELQLTTQKQISKPIKIVAMSDLHIGYHNRRSELARWVDLVNAENPDLVLVAGDIIDISVRPLMEEHMAEEFHRVKAPIYACLGNHEYYSGEPRAEQFYRDAGITLLRDSAAVIDSSIVIIGRDDRMNRRRKSLKELVDSHPLLGKGQGEAFTIVLDHQPYHLEEAEAAGMDFQLSGHTHRGQVWPVSWITDVLYDCSWGEHQRGDTRYYVSSGLGIWGALFRIGTQSEYVVATLTNP